LAGEGRSHASSKFDRDGVLATISALAGGRSYILAGALAAFKTSQAMWSGDGLLCANSSHLRPTPIIGSWCQLPALIRYSITVISGEVRPVCYI
jgi:hypothetical protein